MFLAKTLIWEISVHAAWLIIDGLVIWGFWKVIEKIIHYQRSKLKEVIISFFACPEMVAARGPEVSEHAEALGYEKVFHFISNEAKLNEAKKILSYNTNSIVVVVIQDKQKAVEALEVSEDRVFTLAEFFKLEKKYKKPYVPQAHKAMRIG